HAQAALRDDCGEVEERETDALEQRLEIGHGRAAACASAWRGSRSSKVTKSSKTIGRRKRRPTSRSRSYGGKPPSAGDLIAMSAAVRVVARAVAPAPT